MTKLQSNFAFLKGHNDLLLSIAQAAENNYPDDPNTTLVKLRIFGEYVANHLGTLLNIEPQETQFKLLEEIQRKTNIDGITIILKRFRQSFLAGQLHQCRSCRKRSPCQGF